MQPAHILRFVNVAIAYVFNARIRHLSRWYGIAAADSAWINHAREANKFGTLINGDLFFTHHMQVAVDQYLVNRLVNVPLKVLLALAPPFPLNVLPPEASTSARALPNTPANSAAQYQSQN